MRTRPYLLLVAPLALLLLLPAAARAAQGRYIVTYRDGRAGPGAVAQAGGEVLLKLPGAAAARLPEAAVAALARHPAVASVEPDRPRRPLGQTVPYGVDLIQAPAAWASFGAGAPGVTVCIVDSGIDGGHEDLPATVTGEGTDWDRDRCGHGTHVAGTIAALDNATGVVGVDGGVALHVVRVFNDACDPAWSSSLITAIEACRDAGAQVVNLSLGGNARSNYEEQAFRDFYERDGMLIVASAGNDGNDAYTYPASYDSVISVAAVDSSRALAGFSQRNDQVELAAPGVAVKSTYPVDRYALMSGTSMAAPHVTGAAALVWGQDPGWSNAQVREALDATAADLGAPGRDDAYGYGLVQAADALQRLTAAAIPEDTSPPAIALSPVDEGQAPGDAVQVTATVEDPSGVVEVRLLYRPDGAVTFSEVPMALGADGQWSGEIPGPAVAGAQVAYYLEAVDAAGNAAWEPAGGASAPATFSVGLADTTPPALAHVPGAGPLSEGSPVEVTATATDPSGVAAVHLYWRTGEDTWAAVDMATDGGDGWRGQIPPEAVTPPAVAYRLTAEDVLGNGAAVPEGDAFFRVAVDGAPAPETDVPPAGEPPGEETAPAPGEAEPDRDPWQVGCAAGPGGGASLGAWLVAGLLAAGARSSRRRRSRAPATATRVSP